MKLYGYNLKPTERKIQADLKEKPYDVFDRATEPDGAIEVEERGYAADAGHFLFTFGMTEFLAGTIEDQVKHYRTLSLLPDIEAAVCDIVDDAIVIEDNKDIVSIDLDDTKLSKKIKDKITDEFQSILRMMQFSQKGYNFFRQWYIDGRSYFHKKVDSTKLKDGIKDIIWLDPVRTQKVRERVKAIAPDGQEYTKVAREYFLYRPKSVYDDKTNVLVIQPDSITYVNSGLVDYNGDRIIGYLHKAIKPANQLSLLEDALVIYRLVRAPERRIFYVDVGNLPKTRAEQYMRSIMSKYRNRMVYDGETGEITDKKHQLSMLEDVWLPRREGTRGTEVDTLQGGQHLDEIEDVLYFRKKLYKSLSIPLSRLEAENTVNFSRNSEITRDELKFSKMINRLQRQFSLIFFDILHTQVLLKNIMNEDEWQEEVDNIRFVFTQDMFYEQIKNFELMQMKLEVLNQMNEFKGTLFSTRYMQKEILGFSDEQIEQMEKEIKDEGDDDSDDMDGFNPSVGSNGPQGDTEPQGRFGKDSNLSAGDTFRLVQVDKEQAEPQQQPMSKENTQ